VDGVFGNDSKARAPYEFGVKVSIVTTNACSPGGQFVLHAAALPGNPYDGTPCAPLSRTPSVSSVEIERVYVDKGYRGHDAPKPRRVFISGQKRGVSASSNASYGDAPPSSPSSVI
jgi:transposase, IS5 family